MRVRPRKLNLPLNMKKRDRSYSVELKAAIRDSGLTNEEAAELIGTTKSTLEAWLYNNKRRVAPKWALDLFRLKIKHSPPEQSHS